MEKATMINIDRLNEQQLKELNRFLSDYITIFHDKHSEVKEGGIWHSRELSAASQFQACFDNWKQEWGQSIKFR
tara:strand:+ start:95 stop:316 length:222 start_codon:yes stop_codon:yes gene_type:complete